MKLLIVVACLGALLSAGGTVRVVLRRLNIRSRPVLTCAEFGGAEPGTAVMLVGRTAAGPVLTAPRSRRPCVGYHSVRIHSRVISSNAEETTRVVGPAGGDTTLYGDGARVFLAEQVRTRKLFMGNLPMMFMARQFEDPRNTASNQRTEQEFIVPADRAVVAAGVVAVTTGDPCERFLDRGHWTDGSTQGGIDALLRRFAREVVLAVIGTLAFAGAAIQLTYLAAR
ncbi:hypothetical protein [Streptomyces sp. NPDC008092]|uniref:hypothetical protein n=1 Tax=Streptomyces sp. NPDC008092 TaxID=3364808 RepID=UPI0036EC058C